MKKFSWLIILIVLLIIAVVFHRKNNLPTQTNSTSSITSSTQQSSQENPPPPPAVTKKSVVDPIANAANRVTKKPFGIYITPKTSPVQPERFTGYHTGVDFETFPNEQNIDVPFYAICDGKILVKRTASGYGGVFVQSCTLDNQEVTVIYGHVSLKSIAKNVGDTLAAGDKIGNLGHSPDETDGERKHLHLGIHIGTSINILGYVQKQSDLSGWLDFQKIK